MLALKELLIETDSDLSVVATVSIGFDDSGNLTLMYDRTVYDHPSESSITYAVVDKQQAYDLSRRLKVPLTHLPAYFSKKFAVEPFGYAGPSEARALFKDILVFFSYRGARYRLKTIPHPD